MAWFFLTLPLIFIYIITAYVNRWSAESLWVLAAILIGPLWMFIREVFPGSLKILKSRLNLVSYLSKKLKQSQTENELLRHDLMNINSELDGLKNLWLQNSVPKEKKISHYDLTPEQKITKMESIVENMKMQKNTIIEDEDISIHTEGAYPKISGDRLSNDPENCNDKL